MWANQFDNTANQIAHFESTGPEIWRDTGGKIDAFCASTGTGGTLAGVARYLKSKVRGAYESFWSIRRAARYITTSRTAN